MVKDGKRKINRGLMSILPIQGKVQYNNASGKLEQTEENTTWNSDMQKEKTQH